VTQAYNADQQAQAATAALVLEIKSKGLGATAAATSADPAVHTAQASAPSSGSTRVR
jgi:hypothetical protein